MKNGQKSKGPQVYNNQVLEAHQAIGRLLETILDALSQSPNRSIAYAASIELSLLKRD